MAGDLLQGAIRLVKDGKTTEARQVLEQVIKTDPRDISAWLWYAETWTSTAQRIQVLDACLRVNPANARVQQALSALTSRQKSIIPSQPDITSRSAVAHTPASVAQTVRPSFNDTDPQPKPVPARPEAPTDSQSKPAGRKKPEGKRTTNWFLLGSIILLVAFCLTVGLFAYNSIPADAAKYRHESPIEYYLYVPKNYSSDREWPLFVGIHGSGGTGLECWNLWQTYANRENFILLCPSIADSGGGWYQSDGEAKVLSAINQVRADYRVAPREFLVGFSAGAQFVQGFAFKYPQYVSAVSILSAGNYYVPTLAARGIPFLVVIGDRDDPVAVQGSQGLASALSQGGFDVQYEVLPGVGHTVTDKGRQLTIALFRKAIGK
jgi:predicted esterase